MMRNLLRRVAPRRSDRSLILGFIIIYGFLFYLLKPWLILSLTTTSGGDTGSHHYLAYYMEHFLLPQGMVRGWSPDWYAGFPAFYFYFPLPYVLIGLSDILLPYNLAFKLITTAGIFALPAVTHWALRAMGAQRPMPLLGAGAAAAFLALENNTIYGGNIAAALAGEFSYSLSFALIMVFYGLVAVASRNRWGSREGRARSIQAAATLAAAALSHAIPAAFAVLAAAFFALRRQRLPSPSLGGRSLRILFIGALGFGLVAFWALPLLLNLGWAANMRWTPKKELALLVPLEIAPVLPLVLIGLVWALIKRHSWALFIVWMGLLGLVFFWFIPPGAVWNTRFLPFYYFAYILLAAVGVNALLPGLARIRRLRALGPAGLSVAAITLFLLVLAMTRQLIPSWAEWNYSGYENKRGWREYSRMMTYLAELPAGRVMWEYTPKNEDFGTPRALEIIPFWTGQPTMEGLLIESAVSSPFHFINQAELSRDPTQAIQGIDYPSLDVADGLDHLRLFNVRYFMVKSPEVLAVTRFYPGIKRLKKIGRYTVFEMPTDGYVTVPRFQPQLSQRKRWLPLALDWYRDPELIDAPIVWDFNRAAEDRKVARDAFLPLRGGIEFAVTVAAYDAERPRPTITERVGRDRISFTTNQVGRPHWVKVSYFPNWTAKGADGPYLATPAFMVVIPRQREVTLTFSRTPIDNLGSVLSLGSLVLCFALLLGVRTSAVRDGDGSSKHRSEAGQGTAAGDASAAEENM